MAASVDDSELVALSVTLTTAGPIATDQVRPIIARGAMNVKRQLVAEMGASGSFRGIAGSITYDITETRDGTEAQIGPDTNRRGGSLANIAYFGSPSKPGGASVPDPLVAALAEYPNLERFLSDLIGDLP